MNTSEERTSNVCIFVNSDYIIYSSLGSFYIPCCLMIFLYYRIFKEIRNRAKRSHAKSSTGTTPSSGHPKQNADTLTQSRQQDSLMKPDAQRATDKLAKPAAIDTTSSQQESNSDETQVKPVPTKTNRVRKFIPLVGKKPAEKVIVNVTRSEIDEEDEEEDSELTGSDQQAKQSEAAATPKQPDKKDGKGFYLKKIMHSDKSADKNNNQLDKKKGISAIIKSSKGDPKSKEDALIIANVSALNRNQDEDVQRAPNAYPVSASSKARRLMGRFALSAKLKSEEEPTTLDLDYLSSTAVPLKTIDSTKLSGESVKERSEIEDESSSELMKESEGKVINNLFAKEDLPKDLPKKAQLLTRSSLKAPTVSMTKSITLPLDSAGICVDCGQLTTQPVAHSKTFDQDLNRKIKESFDQSQQLSCIVDIVADFCHDNNEVEILMENTNQRQQLIPSDTKSVSSELVAGEENVEILANRGAMLTDPDEERPKTATGLTCVCEHRLADAPVSGPAIDAGSQRTDGRPVAETGKSDAAVVTRKQATIQTKSATAVIQTSATTTVTSTITTSTITGSSSSNSVKPVSAVNTTNGYLVKSAQDDELASSYETATQLTKQDNKSSTAVRSTDQLSKKKSRFNLGRKQKNSRKKREKASAKRERKATKTLAIVLGK